MQRTILSLAAGATVLCTPSAEVTGGDPGRYIGPAQDDASPAAISVARPGAATTRGGERKVLTGVDCLYDNGLPDGLNGYSNATLNVFGARRTLLDDFTVPAGQEWVIEDFHWYHLWDTLTPPQGLTLEILLRADAGGAPGAPFTGNLSINNYQELATGNTYFGRPEAESLVEFDPIVLGPGTYWFEATIVGPENNFWLTAPVQGNACWVNYDDFGGLVPGFDVFGVDADIAWCLTGFIEGEPEPGKLYLTSLDNGNGSFARYDPNTNAWTTLAAFDTGAQMAVSCAGNLYAWNRGRSTIQIYDPVGDRWSDVNVAPPGASGEYGNLEIRNNGEFLYTESNNPTLYYTVGGTWQRLDLQFLPNAQGDYDQVVDLYVVGEFGTGNAHLIDTTTFADTVFTNGPQNNGERARFGAVMAGHYYYQFSTNGILSFDLGNPGGAAVDNTGDYGAFYDSGAADRANNRLYVGTLDGSGLLRWDANSGGFTPLASYTNIGNHSSLAYVDVCPLDCVCPEDIDRDGQVAFSDILRILGAWGPCTENACDTPGVCGQYTQCGVGQPFDCFCWTTFDGEGVCYQDFPCNDVTDCPDGNCPPGFVCVVQSCCEVNKCVPMIKCDERAANQWASSFGLTGGGNFIEPDDGVTSFGAVAAYGPPTNDGPRPSEMAARTADATPATDLDGSPPVVRSSRSVFFDRGGFNAANPGLPVLDFEEIAPVGDFIKPAPQPWAPSVLFSDPAGDTSSIAIADSGFAFNTPTDVLFMDLFEVPILGTFDPPVNAVGFNVAIGFGGFQTRVEVYAPDGMLLEAPVFDTDDETVFRTFVGFSDIGPIGRIVIVPEPGGFVLIDDFAYGRSGGDPCDRPCPEDLDRDGQVAFSDILQVLGAWGPCRVCDDCEDGTTDSCDIVEGDGLGCIDCITPDGECLCVQDAFCVDLPVCPDGNCPPGFVCCDNTCCGPGVCFPLCTDPLYDPEEHEVPSDVRTGGGVYVP